jgi:rod shape-determining protein MreC
VVIKKYTKQLIIALLLFLIFLPKFYNQKIKHVFFVPFKYPLILSQVSSEGLFNFFGYSHTYRQNKELKQQLATLERKINNLKEAELENKRLKELLDFKEEFPYQTLACKVIGKDSSNWINSIIINKGQSSGLKKDMVIVSYSGLAGKIVEAAGDISRAILITDPSLKVAAKMQRTRDEGLVEGIYKGLMRMKYLPVNSKILKGDKVITSGLSRQYPKGILIGKIISIHKDPSHLYKIAIIEPATDFQKIEEVLCIKEKDSF